MEPKENPPNPNLIWKSRCEIDVQTSFDNVAAPAKNTTTIHGGIFQTVRSRKPANAKAKSRGVKTALVQTGL
jgi:hypothetical protein